MTAEMWSTYYQMTVTQLIKDSLVKLCVEHVPCSGTLEIDGIVCIACGDDSKQLVVKVHQVLDVASQNESRHCNIVGGRVNAKVECHDQLGNDDSTDSINDDQTVDTVPIGQSGNALVSAAPTTPIWKWPSSPPRCHSPVEPHPDIDTQNDDDFPSSRINDREFACERCGQSFHGVLRMQAHTAKVHSRYMCKHCLNTFSLRCNLRRHERLHAGLKPYSCDVCRKSFARSTDLKIHLARHTIVKCSAGSFTCSRCPNKTFSALSGLRWHMHKIHRQQDAVHQCSECGQVFFDRLTYQTHCRLHTDLLVVKPMGDREPLEEDAMDDRGDTGDSNSVSPCNNADPTVTDTSAGPAMVSILKMSVINGRLHRSKQKASGCGSYEDELPEKANNVERPHPEHASKPLSRSHPSCDNGVAVGNDTTNVNDTGRCILTRLLMTAADASRSKRRKGRPVKHVMPSDVVISDVSDSDASDISSGNTFQLKSLTSGTEAVDTPCHNMTLPFDSQVTVPVATSAVLQPVSVITPARLQPMSVVTPARLQPESVVTPARLQPESVVTPARLQPVLVVTPARLQPMSVVTPARLQPESVVASAVLQPVSVITPARRQPESVVTPARLQPESVVTSARLQPESVVTPARLQPESVVTPARLQPESVVTPARLQPESVVTPARLQPESVVTPARLQPESVVTPARLQPELVVTPARLQPESVVTPAILQPVSVVTPARLQPELVVTPARLQPESVVTPARLQPESVITPARLQPESVVTPVRLQPESVVTPVRLQPESVVTPARLQPESVVTPARLQPVSVVTTARLQPESVVTPARLQPVSVVTTARLQPESVVTPARLQPESVVTLARLQPESVVTPARLQPVSVVTTAILQPVSVVTPAILQPESVVAPAILQSVDPEAAVSVLDVESCELATSAADTSASERKGYICSRFNCGKVFVGFSKYELHYTEKHDRYPCHFCDNSFTGKNNRIRHEKTHVGGKSYRCKDCMRMFSRPDSLREHQFTHTASYREQKCRICGATYDKKAQLLSHMKKCFRGMRIVDYNTDSVEVRLPKRGRKEDDHSLLLDGFTA